MAYMKEEQDIIKKCGKGNPFTVPEGYFENFTRNLMTQLPETENPSTTEGELSCPEITIWQRIKPLLYMAAMFIGMIVCARAVLDTESKSTVDDNEFNFALDYEIKNIEQMTDEELATMVDYTMMDDYTLYLYLSEAE